MDINNISECKAYAYDLLVRIEATQKELQAVNPYAYDLLVKSEGIQKELQAVNQQIVKLSQPAPVQPQVETPKVEEVKEETK